MLLERRSTQGVEARHVGELDRQLVTHLGQRVLIAPTLDRRGEDVGDGLEEMDVVPREGPRAVGERPERAERPFAALDDDAQAADDAVFSQHVRGDEPGLGAEVLHDHRLARRQGEAGERAGSCLHRLVAGVPPAPAGARPQHEAVPFRGQLHHPAELHAEAIGDRADGFVEELAQVGPGQRPLPEAGHDGLLGGALPELLLGADPFLDGSGQLFGLPCQLLRDPLLLRGLLAEPLHLPPPLLLGQRPLVLLALVLDEVGRLPLDLLVLQEQLDEDRDLGPEHRRDDRLGQEIDGAQRVAAVDLHLGALERRQEEDRRVLRAVALADQLGRLEAVHARHMDVHQDGGIVLIQDSHQGLLPGGGPNQVQSLGGEEGLQGEQVAGLVVHQQDVDLRSRFHTTLLPWG